MIVLGRITAPYGVKGWLRLHPFGDDPGRWREMPRWWLGKDETVFSGWRAFAVQDMRIHGKGWLVKLAGIDDRTAAEQLVGQFFGAPREALPATEEDEFYWADLVGLQVVNERQESLGRVKTLIESGAHAVLVVTEGEGETARERLLPFVAQVVKAVDVPAGMIHVAWERDW
ncbi:MAG: ribosome maturation factor RimM [Rhodocyclaceae bacterium]|nr:ribosome maturation factor RimM [Rhodocyclaceae bacterium]